MPFLICNGEGEDVLVLTEKTFDDVVNKGELTLVEFFAPWCGHCKSLAPAYAEAATELKSLDPSIILATMDATAEASVARRFGVSGYPTLKVFRKGVDSEYKGPRDAKGIVSYMLKQVGPSAKLLSSEDEVKNFIKHRDVSVIGFFPTKTAAAEAFTKAADGLREDFRFAEVTSKSVLDSLKVTEGVVLYRGENDKVVFPGQGILADWIYDISVAKVGEFTKDNIKRYHKKNLPVVKVYIDVDYASNLKQTNYYLNRLKKVAEDAQLSKKFLFAIADKDEFKDEMEKLGVAGKIGVVTIDDIKTGQQYRSAATEFTVDSVAQFAKDFLDGKLKVYIKSEPVPEKNDEPVKVVVGETFNDIVMDPTKDVMIEFYAPWCGHCKKLTPIYDELAKKLQNVENVVIAKMDATANDSPVAKYAAKGYPTIFFAPANNKQNPITYSGTREVKDMSKWIKENSSSWKKKSEL